MNPGDTRHRRGAPQLSARCNEGRGVNPRDTRVRAVRGDECTLDKGRGVNPGDPAGRARVRRPPGSLNEGRDVKLGATRKMSPS